MPLDTAATTAALRRATHLRVVGGGSSIIDRISCQRGLPKRRALRSRLVHRKIGGPSVSTLCLRRNPAVPNSLFDQRLVETTLPRNFEPNTVSPSYSSPSEVRGELCTGWEIMKSGTANAACTINESDRISPILDRLLQDPGVVPLAGVPFGAGRRADARGRSLRCWGGRRGYSGERGRRVRTSRYGQYGP